MTFDEITFIVWVSHMPLWLVWEIVLLLKRKQGLSIRTISMVAQRRGWQVTFMPYLDGGLPSHFWWNWYDRPLWSSPIPAIIFWLVPIGLFIWDIVWWNRPRETWPRWARVFRFPVTQMVLGVLLAHFLFPQHDVKWWVTP